MPDLELLKQLESAKKLNERREYTSAIQILEHIIPRLPIEMVLEQLIVGLIGLSQFENAKKILNFHLIASPDNSLAKELLEVVNHEEQQKTAQKKKLTIELTSKVETVTRSSSSKEKLITLNNPWVVGEYGLVVSEHGTVIREGSSVESFESAIEKAAEANLSRDQAVFLPGESFSLCFRWSNGFYHWMREALLMLIIAENSGFQGRYLVPSGPSFIKDSLELLKIAHDRILENKANSYICESLVLLSPFPTLLSLQRSKGELSLLRERILSNFEPHSDKSNRIFLSRGAPDRPRNIINEDEVISVVSKFGFTALCAQRFTLSEQIRIFINTDFLIGAHGAGMNHALFMPNRSTIIEFFTPTYLNPCILPIVELLSHSYDSFVDDTPTNEYKYGDDILVSTSRLEKLLMERL